MENNLMDFTCVGFDVKKWPWNGEFNIDETGWDQHEEAYSDLSMEFGLKENEYQLLEIKSQVLLEEIIVFVKERDDCILIAVEFPLEIVKLQDIKYGYETSSFQIDLSGFVCLGLDVCDFDGLFSILHNPVLKTETSKLIPEYKEFSALELVQFSNILEPGHSPFVVAKIYSLNP